MTVFFIVLFITMFIVSVLAFAEFSVNKRQTIHYSDTYRKGKFKDFLYEYEKYGDWRRDGYFPKSHFQKESLIDAPYEIHAGIIKFDGVGMVLNISGYFKFWIWEHKNYTAKINRKHQGKWIRS